MQTCDGPSGSGSDDDVTPFPVCTAGLVVEVTLNARWRSGVFRLRTGRALGILRLKKLDFTQSDTAGCRLVAMWLQRPVVSHKINLNALKYGIKTDGLTAFGG